MRTIVDEQQLAVECVSRATQPQLYIDRPDPVVERVGKYSARAEWELAPDRRGGARSYAVEVEVNRRYGKFATYVTLTKTRTFDNPEEAERWLKLQIGTAR